MQLPDLIARWGTPEGRPFKGQLIDTAAYKANPSNIGCMSAQGQILHLIGGWTADRLRKARPAEADAATAKLLHISRAHANLLWRISDTRDGAPAIVLTDPGAVIGPEWSRVLDFWWHLDQMIASASDTAKEGEIVAEDAAEGVSAGVAAAEAWCVAGIAAGDAVGDVEWDVSGISGRVVAGVAAVPSPLAASGATSEIQGAAILRRDGKPFFFLPLFGFARPEDIPARPADYGAPARAVMP